MQLLLRIFDVDVLLNLAHVLLEAILCYDVSDVVLLLLDAILEHSDVCDVVLLALLLVILLLLLEGYRFVFHDVDVHLVNFACCLC